MTDRGPDLGPDLGPGGGTGLTGRWLGRRAFAEVLDEQLALREAVLAKTADPAVLIVEHPPTLTLGRRARRQDILWTDEQLAAFGVAICETPRGGQVTLHAPGQLVAYPVVPIGIQIRKHVTHLAGAAIELLAELGVGGAELRTDPLGVWTPAGKIASIGVHVRGGITVQGIAINLDVDPRLFFALVSCGMAGQPMVNARALGARPIEMAAAARRYAEAFARRRGVGLRWCTHAGGTGGPW